MATGAERLKEFVVALGFKVDEQQFRAFAKTIEKVTKNVAEIGTAVAAAAVVIDKNVTIMAARFEKLYYSSQRTGATVKSLESLEFGAQNIGFAAGAATSLIEGMTSALRTNPGLAALFSTGDKDPTKQFIAIIERLKKMSDSGPFGHAVAAQYGAMFGMSEPDLLQAEKGIDKLKAAYALREKMFRDAGVNPDDVAKNSVAFENDLRKLDATIDIVRTLILERFMPGIDMLTNGLTRVVSLLSKADVATGGASTYAIGGAGFLVALGALKAIPKVLTAILKRLGFSVAAEGAAGIGVGAAEGGGAAAAAGGASLFIPIVAAILAGLGLGWLLNKTGALDVGGDSSLHSQAEKVRKWFGLDKDPNASVLSDAQDGATRGNNPGNLRAWAKGQATFERKDSGTFVAFASAIDGLSAMAGQLRRYAARHIDTVQGIISTYAPKKDHNHTEAYISEVARKLGVSSGQHLDLNSPGTLQALMHAMIQQEQGKDPYSPSTLQAAIAQRLARDNGHSSGGHTFSSETTIHVAVDKNPRENARAIGDEQGRVNSDMLRNFLPKVY